MVPSAATPRTHQTIRAWRGPVRLPLAVLRVVAVMAALSVADSLARCQKSRLAVMVRLAVASTESV